MPLCDPAMECTNTKTQELLLYSSRVTPTHSVRLVGLDRLPFTQEESG
jgi:hypothetical protein